MFRTSKAKQRKLTQNVQSQGFMLHHAEGLPPHPLWNAYKGEEQKFMKTVSISSIQKGSEKFKHHNEPCDLLIETQRSRLVEDESRSCLRWE